MIDILAIIYLLVALGVLAQSLERGAPLPVSLIAGVFWPLLFGLWLGDKGADIQKKNKCNLAATPAGKGETR